MSTMRERAMQREMLRRAKKPPKPRKMLSKPPAISQAEKKYIFLAGYMNRYPGTSIEDARAFWESLPRSEQLAFNRTIN